MLAGAVPDWLSHPKLMQSHLAISIDTKMGEDQRKAEIARLRFRLLA
jgi:hypothetical protein